MRSEEKGREPVGKGGGWMTQIPVSRREGFRKRDVPRLRRLGLEGVRKDTYDGL